MKKDGYFKEAFDCMSVLAYHKGKIFIAQFMNDLEWVGSDGNQYSTDELENMGACFLNVYFVIDAIQNKQKEKHGKIVSHFENDFVHFIDGSKIKLSGKSGANLTNNSGKEPGEGAKHEKQT